MDAGPSRKRLRRSTRSCYQCRKRKVKCQLTDENVKICAECVKTGTQCTLQPPDADVSSGSSPGHVGKSENDSRLERIEFLLKKLVDAQEHSRSAEASSHTESAIPTSLWTDILANQSVDEWLPFASDGALVVPQPTDASPEKQSLVALLPSAQDAATIVAHTNAWLWGAEVPSGSVLTPQDNSQLREISAISRGSPVLIAKTLLLFALYMQQLPATFNISFLESTEGVEEAIKLIAERVKVYVLSHDEEACSVDSLECLMLLGLIHLNDGEIRKAWIFFRRLLDMSRLKGLHNSFSIYARNSSSSELALHRRIWLSSACGDCYCSLLLGLEPGIGIAPFGPHDDSWKDPFADDDENVHRRICLIVARIAQRNAIGLHEDLVIFQETNEALDKLQDSLLSSWWKLPAFSQDRPLDSARDPNRLICQLWFLQARIFLHLPFAFKSTSDESQNCLKTCMEASRITLQRYLGLQHVRDQLSRCRSVDHSGFTAAVVLLLAKVQLRCHNEDFRASRHDSDLGLLEQVVESFEAVGKKCQREYVARQSSEILSTMLHLACNLKDDFFTNIESSNHADSLRQETVLSPRVSAEGTLGTTMTRMEDIIASSIQPSLDRQSPASRLLEQWFDKKGTGPDLLKCTEAQFNGHDTMDVHDLIDPSILQ